MFCYNCGNKVDDKAVICVKCGAPLTPIAHQQKKNDFVLYLPLILGAVSVLLWWEGIVGVAAGVAALVTAVIFKKERGKAQVSGYYFGLGIALAIIGISLQAIILLISFLSVLLPLLFMGDFTSLCVIL